jgi:hypothetical protein
VIATVILVAVEIAMIWAIAARRPTRDDLFGPVHTINMQRPEDSRPAQGRNTHEKIRTSDEPQLVVEYEELLAADATDDADEPDLDLAQNGVRRFRAAIPEGTLDQLVFGRGRNAASGRMQLDALLNQKIGAVEKSCRLTAAQKQKLHLAGRGDIKRFFDRVESLRPSFQHVHFVVNEDDALKVSNWAGELARDATMLRSSLTVGLFEDGSHFAKTLKTSVAAEQFAAYNTIQSRAPNAGR